jgi:hypothetical protein
MEGKGGVLAPSRARSEEGEVKESPAEPIYRSAISVWPTRYFLTAHSTIVRARVQIG